MADRSQRLSHWKALVPRVVASGAVAITLIASAFASGSVPYAAAAEKVDCATIKVDIAYDVAEMRVNFTINRFDGCFGDKWTAPTRATAVLTREDALGSSSDDDVVHCGPAKKRCHLSVDLPHESLESATYTADLSYFSRSGDHLVTGRRSYSQSCVAFIIGTACN